MDLCKYGRVFGRSRVSAVKNTRDFSCNIIIIIASHLVTGTYWTYIILLHTHISLNVGLHRGGNIKTDDNKIIQ